MAASLYEVLGRPVGIGGVTAGTVHTRTVETIDNDQMHLDVLTAATDPREPKPGTTLTFTTETTDEDGLAHLGAFI